MRLSFVLKQFPPPAQNVLDRLITLSIDEIPRGMLPFFLVDVCMLMTITFVPWVAIGLPQLVLG